MHLLDDDDDLVATDTFTDARGRRYVAGELVRDVPARRGAGRCWTIGRYHLEVTPWRRWSWRWDCSADGVGVGGCRTPWGAWWLLRQWERGACL